MPDIKGVVLFKYMFNRKPFKTQAKITKKSLIINLRHLDIIYTLYRNNITLI